MRELNRLFVDYSVNFGLNYNFMNQNTSARGAIIVTGLCVVGISALVLLGSRHKHQLEQGKMQQCTPGLKEIIHNSSAKGSTVIQIYRHRLVNRVFIVTGASSGIGKQLVTLLAKDGEAHVILAVRNVKAGQDVVDTLKSSYGSKVSAEVIHLDLTSLASVLEFVKQVSKNHSVIHGLVNNAGVYGLPGKSKDGFQLTWQVNVLSHAFLTQLLILPNGESKRLASEDFCVVNVSSELGKLVRGAISQCSPPTTNGASTYDYAFTKASQVLHAHGLHKSFGIRAFAVEPGLVKTDIGRHMSPMVQWINYKVMGSLFLRGVDEGCSTILFCLLAPDCDLEVGAPRSNWFYYANCAPAKVNRCILDLGEVQAQQTLFEIIFASNFHNSK